MRTFAFPPVLVAFAALICSSVMAQTSAPSLNQSVSPSQSTAFRNALSSYSFSFIHSPQYSGLAQNLFLDLPGSVLSSVQATPGSIIPVPTGSNFNLYSFATDPPTVFPQLDWETYLTKDPQLSSSIDVLRTSAVIALATSAQSVIGTAVPISVPPTRTSSSTGGAAAPTIPAYASGAMGAAAGLVGAAAFLL